MSKVIKSAKKLIPGAKQIDKWTGRTPSKPKTPRFAQQKRREDEELAGASRLAEEEARTIQRQGRASTLLTGGRGLLDDEETESRRLLGR